MSTVTCAAKIATQVDRAEVAELVVRPATPDDAPGIHELVSEHLAEGHLLPRTLEEITAHATRFLVTTQAGRLVACGELAPLSRTVGEVRSLVVRRDVRSLGVGGEIIDRLIQRAAASGCDKVCAFTHRPSYFVRHGFSIVPHVWLPEKIVTDCHNCPLFRRCGQYAVVRPLTGRSQVSGDNASRPH
jgi:amino-acid N-acetyltransferase